MDKLNVSVDVPKYTQEQINTWVKEGQFRNLLEDEESYQKLNEESWDIINKQIVSQASRNAIRMGEFTMTDEQFVKIVQIATSKYPSFPEHLKEAIDKNKDWKFERKSKYDPLIDDDIEDACIAWPVEYKRCHTLYKKHQASFWTMEEVDLGKDIVHWITLDSDEQYYMLSVFSFFVSSDTIVNENLARRFMVDIKRWEPRLFYGFQMAMEGIHTETYTLLLREFVKDDATLKRMMSSIKDKKNPAVRLKTKWAMQWIESQVSYHERLVAFAVVEAIFFSSSFCSIGWMKKRGLLPGTTYANDKISADENLHCVHAYTILFYLRDKLPEWKLQEIVASAVEIETIYCCQILPVSLIGMNCDLMVQYVQYVSDVVLQWMGAKPLYNVKNPFNWMELWSLNGITSFFEKRNPDYQLPNVGKSLKEQTKDTSMRKLEFNKPF
jgi:ribonucleotide reductase beta subunit family protein with ferritin-like domain